ncbi:hypothetical protein BO78DRAFT_416355 [Aspergillus sclerotiicarbonarius CBS 121057]|uniref:F-box domain-containing protein n=1 Tax=Aspergillus sclerotiicarbonarius (strain CBS 121057 / IBT 28362) TaxID=1448318 RepID=A0A319F112_ASPSB|nr:hypothetical protein BO78DRAFT_416355 [Aspergillus sclerotiicarbonarius CBS 121057]
MVHILHLPSEILNSIYRALSNIDDALHLARCCTRLHDVFEEQRLEVLRHIIQTADHHTYDPHLSEEIGLHEYFAREMYTTPEIRLDPPHRKALLSAYRASIQPSPVLSGETVWETVVRWQAMRLLFDLYCDASVQESYGQSAFRFECDGNKKIIDTDSPFPPPSGSVCVGFGSLGTEQKQRAYERFYKALTAYWWVVEWWWSAKVDVHKDKYNDCWTRFAMAEELRDLTNSSHAVQEYMDMVEIDDFVWSFLARKALQLTSPEEWMAAWDSKPAHRPLHRWCQNGHDPWACYLPQILQYLRPSSIIELVLASQWASSGDWRVDRAAYLLHLGAMDELYGVYEDGTQRREPAKALIHFFEEGPHVGILDLYRGTGPDRLAFPAHVDLTEEERMMFVAWQVYRTEAWRWDARGRVFFQDHGSSEELLERMRAIVSAHPQQIFLRAVILRFASMAPEYDRF